VASGGAGWTLVGFAEHIEIWEKNGASPNDLTMIVADWIMNRHNDPYAGVRRETGPEGQFDNLWFGPIPGTVRADGLVVCCSYWINESTKEVRCDSIASLHWPV
jgi:hypothetical protein